MSCFKFKWLLCTIIFIAPAYAEEIPAVASDAASVTPQVIPEAAKLTLNDAIQKALVSSPRLKSAEAGVLASAGERTQAGLWHNPELGVEAENFAGGGRYSGFDGSEVTVGVSQIIELGGKRNSRVAIAEQEMALSRFGQTTERINVIRDASNAYANAVAAQETLKLASEQKALAEDLFEEVRERVDAAREPLIQKSKAEITLSTASFAYERAERELSHAKHVLSNLWSGHDDSFRLEEQDFFTLTPPLTEEEVEARLQENPALKRYLANHSRMQAKYELEKAQAIPDPRINVGVRDFRDGNDQALVAGISIPIPVFNRNQGSIERARYEVSKAESDAQTAKFSMIGDVHEWLESQINAYRQSESLKTTILPAAEKAFTLAREGYRAGKFPYLEVLDAQRTLFEVKEQYITSLKEYHAAKAEVERLTAHHVEQNATKEEAHAE